MKNLQFILLLLFSFSKIYAQNLVANPSFEEYTDCPSGLTEFYKVKNWSSPNKGTPDYFNTCCDSLQSELSAYRSPTAGVPRNRLGIQRAKNGKAYSGIIVLDERPPIIEYLQAKLLQPLVAGQHYCVNMYVSLADYSRFAIDKIGIYFSKENISMNEWKPIEAVPQIVSHENVILNSSVKWTLVSGELEAAGGEQFLIIGCFEKPENLKKERTKVNKDQVPYGLSDILSYYYIDEVSVKLREGTQPCFEAVSLRASAKQDTVLYFENLTQHEIKAGNSIVLKNIFFETARSKLLGESFVELNKLVFILTKQYPKMKIEINGHTDNAGDAKYNRQLSEDRAKSVVKYLLSKGIDYHRLSFHGFGFTNPIADKDRKSVV